MSHEVVSAIFRLFAERGAAAYLGESVSQQEHALQTAWAAEQGGAASELIVAALLHDIGHLLDARAISPTQTDSDHGHEGVGAAWLDLHFGPAVTEPVRLHVAAKRYLCAVEPGYFERLSPASVASLRLQGGPFRSVEVEDFGSGPFADAAVALRRWDEQAKAVGALTPALEHFRPHLEAVLRIVKRHPRAREERNPERFSEHRPGAPSGRENGERGW